MTGPKHRTDSAVLDDGRIVMVKTDWSGEVVGIQRVKYDWLSTAKIPQTYRDAANRYAELYEAAGIRPSGGACLDYVDGGDSGGHPLERLTDRQQDAYRKWAAARRSMGVFAGHVDAVTISPGAVYRGDRVWLGLELLAAYFGYGRRKGLADAVE